MTTKPIPVIVKYLNATLIWGFKSDDSCEDRDQDHPDPCHCWYFRDVMNVPGAKIDDNYEDDGFEASKTTTVTRMATQVALSL